MDVRKILEGLLENDLKVTDLTIGGKCHLGCGDCCTDMIPLTKNEANVIYHYVKSHDIKQERWLEGNNLHHLCPFLNRETKACNIYEVRPQVCRNFICNKSRGALISQRKEGLIRAYYNSLQGNNISLHRLFYGDAEREYIFWRSQYQEVKTQVSFEDFLKIMRVLD